MKIHLSAVGTSLLRNAEDKDPKIKDKLITLGLEGWYNLSLDDKKQMVIVQNRSELKDILRNFIRENVRKDDIRKALNKEYLDTIKRIAMKWED
jgi:CRISPR/Cas system-associated protein Csm6